MVFRVAEIAVDVEALAHALEPVGERGDCGVLCLVGGIAGSGFGLIRRTGLPGSGLALGIGLRGGGLVLRIGLLGLGLADIVGALDL